jgi:hypothetical protein
MLPEAAPVVEQPRRIVSRLDQFADYNEEGCPALLQEMRWVYDNSEEPRPCPVKELRFRALRTMYRDDFLKFRDRLEKLESDLLGYKKAKEMAKLQEARPNVPSEWNGKGACPVCKRAPVEKSTEALIGKVEAWMSKQPGVNDV